MSIDEQIKNAEIELNRLRSLKEQKRKEFKPFEEICWEDVYDHIIERYAKPYLEERDDDSRDPQYLFEDMMLTVCPNIFKR